MTDEIIEPSRYLIAFRDQWQSLMREAKAGHLNVNTVFGHDAEWSAWMLGKFRGRLGPGDPICGEKGFLGDVGKRLAFGSERIRREDYTIDMSLVSRDKLIEKEHWGYASGLSVLIEHENDLATVIYELWKLLFLRAPLKVIITYDWREDLRANSVSRRNDLDSKLVQLREMKDKADAFFRENELTRYLIIVGDRKNEDADPRWRWTDDFQNLHWLSDKP